MVIAMSDSQKKELKRLALLQADVAASIAVALASVEKLKHECKLAKFRAAQVLALSLARPQVLGAPAQPAQPDVLSTSGNLIACPPAAGPT